MKIRNLIKGLQALANDYGEDMEVVIAEYQNYGSDWAYNIYDIDTGVYSDFYEDNYDEDNDEPNCVKIILGEQIGTMQDELW